MSEIPSNDDKSQNMSKLLDNELKNLEYSSEAASTISEDTDHNSIDTEYMLRQFLLKPLDPYDLMELILRFLFGVPVFQIEGLYFSRHNNNTRFIMQFCEEIINRLNANVIINYFDDVFDEDFAELLVDKPASEFKEFFQELLKIPTKILKNTESSLISEHDFTLELLMEMLKEYDYDIYPFVKRCYENSHSLLELFGSINDKKFGKQIFKYTKVVKEYLENQNNTDDEATKRRKFEKFVEFVHENIIGIE